MNNEQKKLYQRIKNFVLDDSTADFTFTHKLIKETGWSQKFAQKAIEEYKKFTFLAVVSNHPVVPSEIVDQVWHLHLLYTHSYWQEFCPKILGKPLHHIPSKGSISEWEKHQNMYRKTLASYEFYFAEYAPSDVWKPPHLYMKNITNNSFLASLKNMILQSKNTAFILLISSLALMVTGCTTIVNPLNLTGTLFLQLYLFLITFVFSFSFILQWFFNQPSREKIALIPDLTPYEIAYLSGGEKRAIATVIVSLIERDILQIIPEQEELEIKKPLTNEVDFLDKEVIKAVNQKLKIKRIIEDLKPSTNYLKEKLEKLGLLADINKIKTVKFWVIHYPY